MTTKRTDDDLEQLCASLKLKQISKVLERELTRAEKQGSTVREVLARLLREEYLYRREQSMKYRLDNAKLPERWTLESFPFDQQPGVHRAQIRQLAELDFVARAANVVFVGETAVGKYPVLAVEMMNSIVCQAEANLEYWGHWRGKVERIEGKDDAYHLTLAVRELAHDRNVAVIAVFTKSGRTALLMSKARPDVPILAFTPEAKTYRRAAMYFGVYPHLVSHAETVEEMISVIENALLKITTLERGQQVILVCGYPVHAVRPANMALLHTIGEDFSRLP